MFSLIILIIAGIILIVFEIMLLPGLVAGIIGAIMMIIGIVMMYKQHGSIAGHITVVASLTATAGAFAWALRSKSWQRFSLKTVNDGKVIDYNARQIKTDDEGTALSAIRPMGKAVFDNNTYEVQSMNEWIDAGSKIKVIQVLPNKLIVEVVRQKEEV
ncbi:MAG TPA: NfeD family protein [Bacteroidia bacterium]|nr:NfeD family protein [Bacteroidia bacterium]